MGWLEISFLAWVAVFVASLVCVPSDEFWDGDGGGVKATTGADCMPVDSARGSARPRFRSA